MKTLKFLYQLEYKNFKDLQLHDLQSTCQTEKKKTSFLQLALFLHGWSLLDRQILLNVSVLFACTLNS